jgi:dTDP-4-amino-4,6-dideoxygalactose transaminase
MAVPFLDLKNVNARYRKEFSAVLDVIIDKGWFVMGQEVAEFEKEFAAYCQSDYCVGVANGLDALFVSLKMLGIGKGDEVIVPSNTYIASWLAVSMTGATPVPVEPRIETYNINPDLISAKISNRTKAIMPVHLYGQPCEMDAILKIAKDFGVNVVEDNAQAQGATYNGKTTGSFGIINGTSFYPGKNLGALGDGGAITTSDKTLAERAAAYRNYGSEKKYYNKVQGINSRLDEMQAAFLRIKLKHLNEDNTKRRLIADKYTALLKGVGDVILPQVAKGAEAVYHLYVLRTQKRDSLAEYLNSNGIGTIVHYPVPPHLQQAYSDMNFKKGDLPLSEEIAKTCISLPIWPDMSEAQVALVVEQIKAFYNK